MTYEIRALHAGGILDNAVKLLRRRFLTLFVITLVALIPLEVVRSLIIATRLEKLGNVRFGFTPAQIRAWYRAVGQASTPGYHVLTWLSILLVLPFTSAALTHASSSEYLNQPASTAASLRVGLRKVLSLSWVDTILFFAFTGYIIIAALFVAVLAVALGPLVIIPGVLLGIGCVYLFMRYSLLAAPVVLEDKRGRKVLERSSELMSGNYGTYFVLIGVMVAVRLAIFVCGRFEIVATIPVIQVILQTCLTATLMSFSNCAFVIFYYTCRCKREHFDLSVLADSVALVGTPGQPAALGSTPSPPA